MEQYSLEPVTVVIATLAGESLKKTIEVLNAGELIPSEILVCVPVGDAHKVSDFRYPNVRVVATECRGQVAQRIEGFKAAASSVVVQMDDDMYADRTCLSILLKTLIELGPNAAVAPALADIKTSDSIYSRSVKKRLLSSIYDWLLNGSGGYAPGKINKAGAAIGVATKPGSREILEVDWLAGGCVMHFKKNLILNNFYPFPGKAFCEDIIHSYHLRKNKIKLFINSEAICRLEADDQSSIGLSAFCRNTMADYRARRYYLQLTGTGSLRVIPFYASMYVSYIIGKLTRAATPVRVS